MTEFNTGLPSVRLIQKMIKEQSTVEIKTLSSETLSGKVLWQDSQCLCLQDQQNNEKIIWRQALMYLSEKK